MVPGWIISFAPDAITMSPVKVCTPDHVSVPATVPAVVSLSADTGAAGPTRATNRLLSIRNTSK